MDRKIFIDQKIVKTIFEKKIISTEKYLANIHSIITTVYGESFSFSSKI